MTDYAFDGLDNSQLPVVKAATGHHLVLAPPGCGKTHILAERVRFARSRGVDFADMLCLTFTNRAAREMTARIEQAFPNTDISTLQVGNVHHFCSKFLFEEGRIAADSSIIDDEEAISIIADFRQEAEEDVLANYQRRQEYNRIVFFQHLMYQMKHRHDWTLFLHPECLTDADRDAIKYLCNRLKMDFSEAAIVEIYRNPEAFFDAINVPDIERGIFFKAKNLLDKMQFAADYERYKVENHLLDFEDLLLFTYDAYRKDAACKRYSWVQVDEVQDLNGMQLAIIDLLTAPSNALVMYLGDEQQAIFSFMGAKNDVLNLLKLRCKGNIHHLMQNHRSPKYLLNVFNDYAEQQLKIDRELLPITDNAEAACPDSLRILYSKSLETETEDVVKLARELNEKNPAERTAVVVSSNADADRISKGMDSEGVNHFKVSGRDLFDTPEMKLLMAHLNVLGNEHNFISWTRIVKMTKALPSNALARRFVKKLRELALSPADVLEYEGSGYVEHFQRVYEEEEMVVFDTETTGLEVFEDDIIEISAVRIKGGKQVGEPLDLYLYTDKPILKHLGENNNPLYEIYHRKLAEGTLLSPEEGFRRFFQYLRGSVLVAHNAAFDTQILRHCLQRHAPELANEPAPTCFDSLKLIRLLQPSLRSYKLEALLRQFNLAGENSHKSIDDVLATVSLVAFCAQSAARKVPLQQAFLANDKVKAVCRRLKANYAGVYIAAKAMLHTRFCEGESALNRALTMAYDAFREDDMVPPIARIDYLRRYIEADIIAPRHLHNCLAVQLSACVMELNTLKESDFCNSSTMRERIYVTTIHKSKGLEFDNVIVFDAANGRFPNAFNKSKQADEEDARKFYVAISRAKKRLCIAFALTQTDKYGTLHTRELTPFMNSIKHYFAE